MFKFINFFTVHFFHIPQHRNKKQNENEQGNNRIGSYVLDGFGILFNKFEHTIYFILIQTNKQVFIMLFTFQFHKFKSNNNI